MATAVCIAFLATIISAFASDVPVLMWSPERPLSDLPQAPNADSIQQDSFHANYLKPLLDKDPQVIVAFLQDKLHINDISKYADVYNQESDGGAFKNIKGLLDDSFSLELPRVLGSHSAVKDLMEDFPGTVHELTSTSDLSDLDLGDKGSVLVIVRLQPVLGAQNEEAAIAANDETVGKVCKHLQKRSVKYTALYTAESSAKKGSREGSRLSRHLLAATPLIVNGSWFNVSYEYGGLKGPLYAYLTGVSACIVESYDRKAEPKFCPYNFTIKEGNLTKASEIFVLDGGNNTIIVQLNVSGIKTDTQPSTFDLMFKIPIKYTIDRWEILRGYLTIVNESKVIIQEREMVTRGSDPVVNLVFSYHCSAYEWFPQNMSIPGPQAIITLEGFQIQPFNTSLWHGEGFSLAQDCVPWYTTGIWMALFVIGIHLIILYFGTIMITNLTTNDRFDDPKGKPLVINSGEAT